MKFQKFLLPGRRPPPRTDPRGRPSAQVPGLVGALVALVGLGLWSQDARAEEFTIRNASTALENGVFHLDARIEYAFSDDAVEALENGVPLTVRLKIRVSHPRAYLWDETVAELEQRYELRYHALSEKYIVRNLNTGVQRSFRSRRGAIDALGRIEKLPVLDEGLLDAGELYEVQLRTDLEISALPAPLRPVAWITPDWHLSSEWYVWELNS